MAAVFHHLRPFCFPPGIPGTEENSMNAIKQRLKREVSQQALHLAAAGEHPVWQLMRTTAAEVAMREPLLRRRLEPLLREEPPTAVLAAVLARRLAGDDVPEEALRALLREVFDAELHLLQEIDADLTAVKDRDPACPDYLHVLLNLKGFHALQTHRAAHALWRAGRTELAFTLSSLASMQLGVDIHPAARIGCGVMMDHATGVVIGETAVVEDNVSILQNVTLGGTGKEHGDRHPKIRSGVMLGAGAKVLGNIEIGTMSKVAAGSVVLRDVPAHCTVAGVPARVVREHQEGRCPSEEMDQMI
jgi:serine O-acetyltransferase